jgi:molybdate/tungstate transport system permease protein
MKLAYKNNSFNVMLIVLAIIILFFLSVPILKMFVGVGSDKLIDTIKDGEVIASILLTMKVSLWAMIFVIFTGLPLAYLIARYDFFGKSFLEAIIDIPIMIPILQQVLHCFQLLVTLDWEAFLRSLA